MRRVGVENIYLWGTKHGAPLHIVHHDGTQRAVSGCEDMRLTVRKGDDSSHLSLEIKGSSEQALLMQLPRIELPCRVFSPGFLFTAPQSQCSIAFSQVSVYHVA